MTDKESWFPSDAELDEHVEYWNNKPDVMHEDEPFDSLIRDMSELYMDEVDASEIVRRARAIYAAIEPRLKLKLEDN
jgi:hypothetical protein